MLLTGTFLDEISHDIPHQNWGRTEWDADFAAMKAIGIDTVILIRSGHKRWLTYPSEVLIKRESCYRPPVDLVDMFLSLAGKYGLAALPVPPNWQSAVGQEYTDAFLTELNSSQ